MTANEATVLSEAQIKVAQIGLAALVMWNTAYTTAVREGRNVLVAVREANDVVEQDVWRIHHDRWMQEGAHLADVG